MLGPMHTENKILVMLENWLNGNGCTAALTKSGIVSVCMVYTVIHWCIAFDMYKIRVSTVFYYGIDTGVKVHRLFLSNFPSLPALVLLRFYRKQNHLPFSGLQVLTI